MTRKSPGFAGPASKARSRSATSKGTACPVLLLSRAQTRTEKHESVLVISVWSRLYKGVHPQHDANSDPKGSRGADRVWRGDGGYLGNLHSGVAEQAAACDYEDRGKCDGSGNTPHLAVIIESRRNLSRAEMETAPAACSRTRGRLCQTAGSPQGVTGARAATRGSRVHRLRGGTPEVRGLG